MSEWLNKYVEARDELMDELVRYHKLNVEFMERQAPRRTQLLRGSLKRMRKIIRQMEDLSQQRMKERSKEWLEAHPARGKIRYERNNKGDQGSS